MMKHDFIMMNACDIPQKDWYYLIDDYKYISIHDDLVINNPLFLKGFASFKCSFKNLGEGLDYHGITVIPTTSLNDFINNVEKVKPQVKKKAFIEQLDELIAFSKQALAENKYLVHYGM